MYYLKGDFNRFCEARFRECFVLHSLEIRKDDRAEEAMPSSRFSNMTRRKAAFTTLMTYNLTLIYTIEEMATTFHDPIKGRVNMLTTLDVICGEEMLDELERQKQEYEFRMK